MPERAVLPKPLQQPHPPMWVTVTSPGTELDAADRGIGWLGVATAGFAEQAGSAWAIPTPSSRR
jgi:alkanesulfonate monooxygenase SsuD/methylene tetrahydromethanopterin reductase-like flavin-dependent oxidoreductase (luciferase family)